MIRLIGLDLDGTVFNDKKEITSPVREAIMRATQLGVVVLPATGRPQSGISKEFLEIPGVRYALSSNGAAVRDLLTGETVYHCYVAPDIVRKIVQQLDGEVCAMEVYKDGEAYTDERSASYWDVCVPNEYVRAYVKKTRIVEASLAPHIESDKPCIEKINISFSSEKERHIVEREIKKRGDVLVTHGLPNNLEINAIGADKGEGLLRLGELLHIEREEIAACGDSINDLSMIRKVGLGVAMGNALPEVKKAAKFVVASNENDGVAQLLQKVICTWENQ